MGTKKEELASTTGCLAKAARDEPIFVLRAQDKLAPMVVQYWIQLVEAERRATGASTMELIEDPKLQAAHNLSKQMEEWQREHGCKVPD
jgi:hypothetical protein